MQEKKVSSTNAAGKLRFHNTGLIYTCIYHLIEKLTSSGWDVKPEIVTTLEEVKAVLYMNRTLPSE